MKLGLGLGLSPKLQSVGLTLLGISPDAFYQFSANQSASYSGTGQEWTSLINNHQLYLGTTSGSDVSDPTFNVDKFDMDGNDIFSWKGAVPSELNNVHKTTGGQPMTFIFDVTLDSLASTQYLMSTSNFGGSHGIAFRITSGGALQMVQQGSSLVSRTLASGGAITAGSRYKIYISVDCTGNTGTYWINTSAGTSWTPNASTSTTDPTDTFSLYGLPNGANAIDSGNSVHHAFAIAAEIDDDIAAELAFFFDYLEGIASYTPGQEIIYDFSNEGTPFAMDVSRAGEGVYINSDGKYAIAAANEPRFTHNFDGTQRRLIQEEARTCKNEYARPSADAVTDHFATGSSDVSVVTDSGVPISTDFTNNTSVWEIAASGSDVTVEWAGTVGNTNVHNIQILHKITDGDGFATLTVQGNGADHPEPNTYLNAREWAYTERVNITPTATTDKLRLVVPDGMTIRFTMANLQEDRYTSAKYRSHTTMPIDTAGASASRAKELIKFDNIDSVTADNDAGFVLNGLAYGGENGACVAGMFYNSGSAGTNYHQIRLNNGGSINWVSFDGTNVDINDFFGDTSIPAPWDLGIAGTWSSGDSSGYFRGRDTVESSGTNLPSGIDSFAFYRADNAANEETTIHVHRIGFFNKKLSDVDMKRLSGYKEAFTVATAGQSNSDFTAPRRLWADTASAYNEGNHGGTHYFFKELMRQHVGNIVVIRSTDTENDNGGGSVLKAYEPDNGKGGYYWDEDNDTRGTHYDDILQVYTNNGVIGTVDWIIWDEFQHEIAAPIPTEDIDTLWKPAMRNTFLWLRELGGSNCKIAVQLPARRALQTGERLDAFRQGYQEVANEFSWVHIAANPFIFNTNVSNASHFEEVDYIKQAEWVARFILDKEGVVDLGNTESPRISSATYSGSTITVNCTTENGAELSAPSTSSNPFYITADGGEQTVSSWSVSGTTITINMSSSLSGDLQLIYPYDFANIDEANYIRDDSAWGLPLAFEDGISVIES